MPEPMPKFVLLIDALIPAADRVALALTTAISPSATGVLVAEPPLMIADAIAATSAGVIVYERVTGLPLNEPAKVRVILSPAIGGTGTPERMLIIHELQW